MNKNNIIMQAVSMPYGIRFYSNRHQCYSATAIIKQDGEIITKWEKTESNSRTDIILNKIYSVLTTLIIFLSFSDVLVNYIIVAFLINSIFDISEYIYLVVYYNLQHKRNFKFHSAEHMIINAYKALKRAPTLEEARTYSRISNDCGSNIAICSCITALLMAITACILPDFLRPFCLYVIYYGMEFIRKKGAFNFAQLLTTKKCTDKELKVAIAGLELLIEKEKEDIS